jgi:hypothetical protein
LKTESRKGKTKTAFKKKQKRPKRQPSLDTTHSSAPVLALSGRPTRESCELSLVKHPLSNSSGLGYFIAMSTVREIEAAIEKLPLPERLRLYKDMPQLIGRSAEDLDWQRLGLENFFHDDSPEDSVYDNL